MQQDTTKRPVRKKKVVRRATRQLSALEQKAKTANILGPLEQKSIQHNVVLTILLLFMVIATITAIVAYVTKPIEREYVIQNEKGQIIEELYVNGNAMSDQSDVAARTDYCIRKTLDLNFEQWKRQLSSASECYTKRGFNEVIVNIDNQGIVRDITSTHSVATLTPKQPIKVVASGTDALGRKNMKLEGSYVYIHSHSLGDKGLRRLRYNVQVIALVKEVSLTENPYGHSIDRLTVKIRNN